MSTETRAGTVCTSRTFRTRPSACSTTTGATLPPQCRLARPADLPAAIQPLQHPGARRTRLCDLRHRRPQRGGGGTDVAEPGAGQWSPTISTGTSSSRCADDGHLNSPWGLAIAPAFGPFGGALLVANFGDGTIVAFDTATGAFHDYLRDASGKPIEIDGLWGLAFGNGVSLGDADSLYFTAGPNEEQDGIFGRLRNAAGK